jgi:hypothetical protein
MERVAARPQGDADPDAGVAPLQDDLVMILMPRVTFEAFRALGQARGCSPGETMGWALKALEAHLAKVGG